MKTSQILLEAANLLFEQQMAFSCSTITATQVPYFWGGVKEPCPTGEEAHNARSYYTNLYRPDSPHPLSSIWASDFIDDNGWPEEGTEEGRDVRVIALLLAREVALSEGL